MTAPADPTRSKAAARPGGAPTPLDLQRLDALDLPVEAVMSEVRVALGGRGVAVLQAEPGAGKTTVVPLRLADEPWLAGTRIVVLEPRRLAARAAARRMAALLGEPVGATVGFRTRDERRVGPDTRIEVVTEGILTRSLQRDPSLPGVGLVMFDEFHERSLQGDLGLALALEARRELRPDLRVLATSATLEVAAVATRLGDDDGPAPVVASQGRVHPIELVWRPRRPRQHLEPAVADAVRWALRTHTGDVLAFLPGAAAIERTARLLAETPMGGGEPGPRRGSVSGGGSASGGGSVSGASLPVDVRRLYGALDAAEQDAALAPAPVGRRKVVLATDIAETSLTVDGVTVVVDGGEARSPRFDPGTGMTRLTTVSVSKASAEQRAGRAGRLGPGVAVRLWSKVEHATRAPFTPPEITQVDLAGLALDLAEWGSPDPAGLAFLDQPPSAAMASAWELLGLLGAVDGDRRLTPTGRAMVALPLHPRLAAVVVAGALTAHGPTACALAALLDERDVLQGRPDEVPVDLTLRLELLDDPGARDPRADGGALRRARQRARDLARRAGVRWGPVEPDVTGALLLAGYPDRLAQGRGGRGRFRLRAGSGAWMAATDVLAGEAFVVVADLDPAGREARIRRAAAIDLDEVLVVAAAQVAETSSIGWDVERGDVTQRTERRLDRLVLAATVGPPPPGPLAAAALVEHVRRQGLDVLPWTPAARAVQHRLVFLRTRRGASWPDVSDDALRHGLDSWLVPLLPSARQRADLARLDLRVALMAGLDHQQRRQLDELAPGGLELPSGRRVQIDYATGDPVVAVAVQELFGLTRHPTVVGGEVPVVLHLLSPAGRPVQVTADLPGFWAGSWRDVRKDMAGRYPKHAWPDDPARATPRRRPSRR